MKFSGEWHLQVSVGTQQHQRISSGSSGVWLYGTFLANMPGTLLLFKVFFGFASFKVIFTGPALIIRIALPKYI